MLDTERERLRRQAIIDAVNDGQTVEYIAKTFFIERSTARDYRYRVKRGLFTADRRDPLLR